MYFFQENQICQLYQIPGMLQKCTLKGSYSIPSKRAVLKEEKYETIIYTHECCIRIEIWFKSKFRRY